MSTVIYTDLGAAFVVDQIFNGGGTATFYIGWGSGGSGTMATAVKADVDLFVAATESRVTATAENQPNSDINQWIGTLTAGTAKTIEEVGLFFDATSTAPSLIIHANHGAIALATDDRIEYTLELKQT